VAAMQGTLPEPVRPEDVALFERERELGWMPLGEAFEQLRSAVPELDRVQSEAERLAADPESFGITTKPMGVSSCPRVCCPTPMVGSLGLARGTRTF